MPVSTYKPNIVVWVTKNVHRINGVSTRVQSESVEFDLVPYLGEGGEVTVTKSIYQPMGVWNIVIVDKVPEGSTDTVYALVEPFDFVEIHMARSPHEYQPRDNRNTPASRMPLLMRGFVREVRRVETMGSDGRPRRKVVISGNDVAAVFNFVQIYYLKAYSIGQGMLTLWRAYQQYGLGKNPQTPEEFMRATLSMANEYLNGVFAVSLGNEAIPVIELDATVTEGVLNPFGIQPFEGALWNLMIREADTPWNELFVEDREDGMTYLVYRPSPFKDIDGNLIQQGGVQAAQEIDVDISDVVALDASRSDHDVANFYWVSIPSVNLFGNTDLIAVGLQQDDPTIYVTDHPNCDPNLYGDRRLQVEARHGFTGQTADAGNLPKPEQLASDASFLDWARHRREILIEFNRDNVAFENGHMTLKGNERVRPGRYIKLRRGSLEAEYYAHSVTHSFTPFSHYLTHLEFSRGTGAIARSRMESSPYFGEGRKGPYDE